MSTIPSPTVQRKLLVAEASTVEEPTITVPSAETPRASLENGRITIETAAATDTLYQLTSWATEQGLELDELTVTRTSLEDVYLQLTENAKGEEEGGA